MSHGFSADLRSRVISVISDGLSTRQAAARLGVGVSTAGEWYRRYRDNGETAARKQGQPPGSKLDTHEAFILGLVRDNSDIGLEGIAGRSLAERSVSAAPSTVWTFFKKRNITCKIKMAHASERQRSDVKAARETWSEGQPGLDPHKLVFIDETGASTRMTRLRDRAGRAQRCRAAIPHGHWKTTTFTAGLRVGAMIAPMVLDGPMNGDAFLACIRHVVVPELEKGAVVIMDNLASHKSRTVRKAVRAAGARLWFLPKCAPDLNPIEQTFAQIKHCQVKHRMRLAQKRSVDDIWPHLGYLVGTMQPDQCANHFKNAGHAPVKT